MKREFARRQFMQLAGWCGGAALATASTGCGGSAEPSAAPGAKQDYSHEEYVWLCANVNLPLFKAHDHPALEIAAKELGVKTTIAGPDTDDVPGLIATIEQVAVRRPAGMMIVGWNPKLMTDVINKTVESGIPVVCVDADVPHSKRLAFIGTDWRDLGVRQGEALIAALAGRKGEVAMLGLTEQFIDQEAFAGFRSIVEPAGLTVLEPQNDEGKKTKATEIAAALLQAKPDLIGMAGFDSESGPGLAQAIQEAGKAGKIVATCVDAERPHLQYLKDGVLTACIGQKRELFTYYGVKALFDVNRAAVRFTKDDRKLGIAPIPVNFYTGTYTVTADNVDLFLS
jgi:ABC-type sugar transport system substrate-binding protein